MKFSQTLSLNANPDWMDHYIQYTSLKRMINENSTAPPGTTDASAPNSLEAPDAGQERFLQKLSENASHVREFYDKTLEECNHGLSRLKPVLERSALNLVAMDEEEEPQESTVLLSPETLRPLSKVSKNEAHMEDLRRDICDLYTQYYNLQTFATLNATAVRKILKKYDKTLNTQLQDTQAPYFQTILPFNVAGTPEIDQAIRLLNHYFAHFFCNDDKEEAYRRMKIMVREVVTFQRRSVWLDVIKDHRRHESVQMGEIGLPIPAAYSKEDVPEYSWKMWAAILCQPKVQMGLFSLLLFVSLLTWPGLFDDDPVKRNALAIFVLVSVLWASEVFPLFVTAMLIPFLSVVLRVIVVDEVRLPAPEASKHVFQSMFSHVIMLLIGGFSIAAALSKHNIAKSMATSIAVKCGSGIRTVLLVNMFLATIASMWISNVASPVLCYSLVAPILKAATAETHGAKFGTAQQQNAERDQRLCRALVMGIALASNVGGMASPISSPQNLFAIEYTPIGWLAWFTVSIPLCIVLNLTIWVWLVYCFQLPSAESAAVEKALQRSRLSSEQPFTPTQNFVVIVSTGVVLLWCASVNLSQVTGQMGVLGIVPVIIFFGTHILSKEDLNNFLWNVVLLAMGGLVLGEMVECSGLLDVVAHAIAIVIEQHDLSLWETLCIFTLLILVCTTFVSHTVGAIVVLPILQSIGAHMSPTSHAKELVFAGALACSAAMGLPVSGFPNMTAASQEDHLGKHFLVAMDFIKYAVPASLMSWCIIVTFGYTLVLVAIKLDG